MFMTLTEYLQLLDWTGRQFKPNRRGAIPNHAPPTLDRLNQSAELWLHAVEHLGKRRSANRITPASRFNAPARPADSVLTSRQRWKVVDHEKIHSCDDLVQWFVWMAPGLPRTVNHVWMAPLM
jgi:hypothetical protein